MALRRAQGSVSWLLGLPYPYLSLALAPTPTLHSGTQGKTESGKGLRWETCRPQACFSHAQVHTCKDGHVGLSGIKGASSLPTQLLTLLLQRSYLEAEGAGSRNPCSLGV